MIKLNRLYKLNEKEFTDILRFVKFQFPKLVNDEKYIESLNRVADAFTNNKVLYLSLSKWSIHQPLLWHYRTSYSNLYCRECLEYKDIIKEYANFDTTVTKKIIENKEEKVMEENKIQGITNIINKYRDDAERELNRLCAEQQEEIKAKDPNVIALKQYVEVLNKNRAENTKPYDANIFNEIYTAETEAQLVKVYNDLMSKKNVLFDLCNEVYNLCMLCDTYEQMRQVLADYDIIPNTKKRGK